MTVMLPEDAKAWLDSAEFATLATVLPDGQPHLSVVWVARDGEDVLCSTVRGRRKERNLARDPRATLLCYPREQPYRYLEVRGRVTLTEEGARQFIDTLAERYTGSRPYTMDGPDDVRVTIRLTPEKVVAT